MLLSETSTVPTECGRGTLSYTLYNTGAITAELCSQPSLCMPSQCICRERLARVSVGGVSTITMQSTTTVMPTNRSSLWGGAKKLQLNKERMIWFEDAIAIQRKNIARYLNQHSIDNVSSFDHLMHFIMEGWCMTLWVHYCVCTRLITDWCSSRNYGEDIWRKGYCCYWK